MTYTRIYTGTDGETHLQDVELDLREAGNASLTSTMFAAKGIIFRSSQSSDYFVDWHNAPRRQFVVNLTGEVEITVSDGESRRFGPGSILLAEDVTGKGHISKGIGSAERRSLFIPLAD
jgi:hypothetical protein